MRPTAEEGPVLDLKAPANVQDPFPLYRELRDRAPLHWSESQRAWVVSRYSDVLEVLNRPGRFSSDRFRRLDPRYASDRTEVKAVGEVLGDWLVFRDPPDHTRLRSLLQKSFTPRHLEANRSRIQATIDDLLGRARGSGRMDFIREFAFPLPALVIAMLLGAPAQDIEPIKCWSDRLAAYLGGAVDGRDNFGEARAGLASLVDYFRSLLRERRQRPRDDLVDLMLRAEHEGERLGEEEVVANCVLLLFAGHETTTNLLGNGLFHLLRHPRQMDRLRGDPALLPSAVEEFLRFDGPVPATAKVATEDVAWHGCEIQRGQMVVPLMASANRDPRHFDEPDVLDVGRGSNRHLGFGFGIHFCLGAPLARLEAQLAFGALLRQLSGLTLATDEARWKPMLFLRGLETLEVRWDDVRE